MGTVVAIDFKFQIQEVILEWFWLVPIEIIFWEILSELALSAQAN